MISVSSAFAPYIDGGGLTLGVDGGVSLVDGIPTLVLGQVVSLTALSVNYVQLSLTSGSAQVSTTGFTAGYYPIAIAVTGFSGVLSLKDVRCDVLSVGGGGGGSADSIITVATSQGITLPTGGNLYVQATAGIAGLTLTLQTATGVGGQKATIIQVDQGIGGVLVNTTGGQTINGGTSYELTNQWQSFTVESNNANWRVIATAG
jgi:hypothetical protein